MNDKRAAYQKEFIDFVEDMPRDPSLKRGFMAALKTRDGAKLRSFFVRAGYAVAPGVIAAILTNADGVKKIYAEGGY